MANSGHCTIITSKILSVIKSFADNDKVLTRQILSTKTICVLKSPNKLSKRVAKTIGTQVPGPFTKTNFGLFLKITDKQHKKA